jgi:hypothetical protein
MYEYRSILENIWHYGVVLPIKIAYGIGIVALALNTAVAEFPGREITETQAENIIESSMQKPSFKGKKINLVVLPERTLDKYNLGGTCYPSDGEFYILFDKNNIHIKPLQHEIAHVKYRQAPREKHSLEEVLKYVDVSHSKGGSRKTFWGILKYLYSPEETACNVYAILHSNTQ